MGGPKITFKEYLDLNVEEGEGDYPLKGDRAGIAETLNGRFKALGLEVDQLYRDTPVQADDGSVGAGAQPPGVAQPGQESSLEMLVGDVPVLTPPQRSGLQTGAEVVTSMTPDFVSDEVLARRLQEMAEQFPSLKTALESPQGKEVFKRLMELRR